VKRQISLLIFVFLTITGGLSAQGLSISGILDSTFSLRLADTSKINFGFEEYANLRFQSKIRDRASVYGAVNLTAAAGDYAAAILAAAGSPFNAYAGGENYIAAIELERLYFRLNFEAANFDGGLLRLPFGYGLVWGPTDFLNPKNPLIPDARPRAVLGAGLSYYPSDELKLMGFYAAPRSVSSEGGRGKGSRIGVSMDKHSEKVSIQTLYSFETPDVNSANGIHRAGFSVKADLQAGIVIETLYTYNHEAKTKLDGLSFSIGADYSLLDGNLIALAEYLYNGETSSTALGYGGSFPDRHYLYTGVTLRFNDYTNINAALISGFNDVSFTPVVTLNHDLFQGAVLTVMLQIPLHSENKSGNQVFFSAKLRLRF
jgi:hypothetical protein